MGDHIITMGAVGMVVGTFADFELQTSNFLLQTQVTAIACTNSHAQSVVQRTTARDLPAEHQHLTDASRESETATSNPIRACLQKRGRTRL